MTCRSREKDFSTTAIVGTMAPTAAGMTKEAASTAIQLDPSRRAVNVTWP